MCVLINSDVAILSELSPWNCCMVSTKKVAFMFGNVLWLQRSRVCVCVCVSCLNNRIACLLWGHQRQSLLFSLPFYHLSIQPLTNRPKVQWTDAKHIVLVCLLSNKATLSFLTLSALPPFTDLKGLGCSLAAESISLESKHYDSGAIIKLYGMPLDNQILNLKPLAVNKCEKIYTCRLK